MLKRLEMEGMGTFDWEIDPPQLLCLGSLLIGAGDDNCSTLAQIEYGKQGSSAWKTGPPCMCVRLRFRGGE